MRTNLIYWISYFLMDPRRAFVTRTPKEEYPWKELKERFDLMSCIRKLKKPDGQVAFAQERNETGFRYVEDASNLRCHVRWEDTGSQSCPAQWTGAPKAYLTSPVSIKADRQKICSSQAEGASLQHQSVSYLFPNVILVPVIVGCRKYFDNRLRHALQ